MIPKIHTYILILACLGGSLCAQAPSVEAKRLMQATNEDRAMHGLGPLRWDPALARAVQSHAYPMVRHVFLLSRLCVHMDHFWIAHDPPTISKHYATIISNLA